MATPAVRCAAETSAPADPAAADAAAAASAATLYYEFDDDGDGGTAAEAPQQQQQQQQQAPSRGASLRSFLLPRQQKGAAVTSSSSSSSLSASAAAAAAATASELHAPPSPGAASLPSGRGGAASGRKGGGAGRIKRRLGAKAASFNGEGSSSSGGARARASAAVEGLLSPRVTKSRTRRPPPDEMASPSAETGAGGSRRRSRSVGVRRPLQQRKQQEEEAEAADIGCPDSPTKKANFLKAALRKTLSSSPSSPPSNSSNSINNDTKKSASKRNSAGRSNSSPLVSGERSARKSSGTDSDGGAKSGAGRVSPRRNKTAHRNVTFPSPSSAAPGGRMTSSSTGSDGGGGGGARITPRRTKPPHRAAPAAPMSATGRSGSDSRYYSQVNNRSCPVTTGSLWKAKLSARALGGGVMPVSPSIPKSMMKFRAPPLATFDDDDDECGGGGGDVVHRRSPKGGGQQQQQSESPTLIGKLSIGSILLDKDDSPRSPRNGPIQQEQTKKESNPPSPLLEGTPESNEPVVDQPPPLPFGDAAGESGNSTSGVRSTNVRRSTSASDLQQRQHAASLLESGPAGGVDDATLLRSQSESSSRSGLTAPTSVGSPPSEVKAADGGEPSAAVNDRPRQRQSPRCPTVSLTKVRPAKRRENTDPGLVARSPAAARVPSFPPTKLTNRRLLPPPSPDSSKRAAIDSNISQKERLVGKGDPAGGTSTPSSRVPRQRTKTGTNHPAKTPATPAHQAKGRVRRIPSKLSDAIQAGKAPVGNGSQSKAVTKNAVNAVADVAGDETANSLEQEINSFRKEIPRENNSDRGQKSRHGRQEIPGARTRNHKSVPPQRRSRSLDEVGRYDQGGSSERAPTKKDSSIHSLENRIEEIKKQLQQQTDTLLGPAKNVRETRKGNDRSLKAATKEPSSRHRSRSVVTLRKTRPSREKKSKEEGDLAETLDPVKTLQRQIDSITKKIHQAEEAEPTKILDSRSSTPENCQLERTGRERDRGVHSKESRRRRSRSQPSGRRTGKEGDSSISPRSAKAVLSQRDDTVNQSLAAYEQIRSLQNEIEVLKRKAKKSNALAVASERTGRNPKRATKTEDPRSRSRTPKRSNASTKGALLPKGADKAPVAQERVSSLEKEIENIQKKLQQTPTVRGRKPEVIKREPKGHHSKSLPSRKPRRAAAEGTEPQSPWPRKLRPVADDRGSDKTGSCSSMQSAPSPPWAKKLRPVPKNELSPKASDKQPAYSAKELSSPPSPWSVKLRPVSKLVGDTSPGTCQRDEETQGFEETRIKAESAIAPSLRDRFKVFQASKGLPNDLARVASTVSPKSKQVESKQVESLPVYTFQCIKQRIDAARSLQTAARMMIYRNMYNRKIKAVVRIQAFARGVTQRLNYQISALQHKLDVIRQQTRNDVMLIQMQKWQRMESIRKELQQAAQEDEPNVDTNDVIENLKQENNTLRDSNIKIAETTRHFETMREMTSQNLAMNKSNFETMRQAVNVLSEKNDKLVRKSEKMEVRLDRSSCDMEDLKASIECEKSLRSITEKAVAAIIEHVQSRSDQQRLISKIVALSVGEECDQDDDDDDSIASSSMAVDPHTSQGSEAFEISVRLSEADNVSILGDNSSRGNGSVISDDETYIFEEIIEEEVLEDEDEGEETTVDGADDLSCQSSVYVEKGPILL